MIRSVEFARLADRDGDGQMDERTVFVDRLSWPTAVHAWRDGVLVIAPPRMIWYRDTDGDGRHDTSEVCVRVSAAAMCRGWPTVYGGVSTVT